MLAQELYFDFLYLDFSPDPKTFRHFIQSDLVHICIVNPGYWCPAEILGYTVVLCWVHTEDICTQGDWMLDFEISIRK